MNSEKALFAANMLASRFFNKPLIADKVENITVVKWDEIGDMVNALHVLEALHEQFPKARISVLCKPFVATLLEGNPSVHRIVTRMDALPQNSQLWVELRGTWRTLWKSLLSGVQRRLDRGTVRYKQRGNQPHEQITNWRIIEPVLDRQEEIRTQLFIESKHAQSAKDILTKLNLNQFVILHPGWVKTDMGGDRAPVEIHESVAGMRNVLASRTLENTGEFVQFDGEMLPW